VYARAGESLQAGAEQSKERQRQRKLGRKARSGSVSHVNAEAEQEVSCGQIHDMREEQETAFQDTIGDCTCGGKAGVGQYSTFMASQ